MTVEDSPRRQSRHRSSGRRGGGANQHAQHGRLPRGRSGRSGRSGARQGRRVWVLALVGLAIVVLGALAWVGVRGYLAYHELSQIQPLGASLQAEISAGDLQNAGRQTAAIEQHSLAAAELTGDPVWRAVELIPFLGPNLEAVRTISASAAALATDVVTPLVAVSHITNLADLKPINGRIDTTSLAAAAPALDAAAGAARLATDDIVGLDQSQLLRPLAKEVESAMRLFGTVTDGVTGLSNAAALLPDILGANGDRNYIVIVQNNAELRATGGIPGALAMLHTSNGEVTLTRQTSTADIPAFAEPVIALPQGTENVFGRNPALVLQDTTMTPDFSLTARSVSAMWTQTFGDTPDGVISLDPVTLRYLLQATGPVTLPTGDSLTAENATALLLNEVYTKLPNPRDQDAFFAGAAAAVFAKISAGDVDTTALLTALTRAGSENRVFLFSADETLQAIVADTTLGGIVPPPTLGDFGLFLNDQTAAKMDYFLEAQIATGVTGCRIDGKQTFVLRVTLTNTAPADAALTLSDYITGAGQHGTPPGNIRTSVVVYGTSAQKGTWGEVLAEGQHFDSFVTSDGDHSVVQAMVELAPGESRTLTFRMLGSQPTSAPMSLLTTPLLENNKIGTLAESCALALK